MCQNSMNELGPSGNYYAEMTANTGMRIISAANPNLDGSGTIVPIITGAQNGTVIKSVIIKAIEPVTTGMVRLFIENTQGSSKILYKEIPVNTTPSLAATPTPAPVLPTYEIMLAGGLKLNPNFKLSASTQNAQSFNIIAEGLDWAYPAPVPTTCCNFKQETAVTGLGVISTANTNLNGSGSITSIYQATAGTNGSLIKAITIKALQSTTEGMVRLFLSPDGITWSLMKEVYIPQSAGSSFEPTFKQVLNEDYNLKSGYFLGASTQLGQSFAITVEGTDWIYGI